MYKANSINWYLLEGGYERYLLSGYENIHIIWTSILMSRNSSLGNSRKEKKSSFHVNINCKTICNCNIIKTNQISNNKEMFKEISSMTYLAIKIVM